MRGEHTALLGSGGITAGSSPHARGAREGEGVVPLPVGIIPACAGSTATWGLPTRTCRDHPRMRGEHDMRIPPRCMNPGSSPHARGARFSTYWNMTGGRIIPACAGSTLLVNNKEETVEDHPRMRGEHAVAMVLSGRKLGSSPHARGALVTRGR